MVDSFHTYDPRKCIALYGTVPISGWGENAMFGIEESGPLYVVKHGVQGDVTRTFVAARSALVTFPLMNSSRSNAYLSGIVNAALAIPGSADVVPIFLQDKNGTSLFTGLQAWIEERPKPVRGKEAFELEWKIRVINYEFFEGGI